MRPRSFTEARATVAALALCASCVGGSEAQPWDEVTGLPEGTDFVIEVPLGQCEDGAELDVGESSEEVIVEVHVSRRGYCTNDEDSIREILTLSFELENPLGDRPLVDPACGTESGQIFGVCTESEQERKARPTPPE